MKKQEGRGPAKKGWVARASNGVGCPPTRLVSGQRKLRGKPRSPSIAENADPADPHAADVQAMTTTGTTTTTMGKMQGDGYEKTETATTTQGTAQGVAGSHAAHRAARWSCAGAGRVICRSTGWSEACEYHEQRVVICAVPSSSMCVREGYSGTRPFPQASRRPPVQCP